MASSSLCSRPSVCGMVPAAIRGGCPPLSRSSQRGASLLSFDLGLEVLQVLFSQHRPTEPRSLSLLSTSSKAVPPGPGGNLLSLTSIKSQALSTQVKSNVDVS